MLASNSQEKSIALVFKAGFSNLGGQSLRLRGKEAFLDRRFEGVPISIRLGETFSGV